MDNFETPNNPEWLDDAKERNMRFGRLGLSENQEYSELSDEEKQYLNMNEEARTKISRSYFIFSNNKDFSLEDEKENRRPYFNQFIDYYNVLSNAITSPNNQYTEQLNIALTDAILNLNIPNDEIRKIILMMKENDTPNFAKQMVAFKIQHPIDRLSDELAWDSEVYSLSTGGSSHFVQSPILRKTIFDHQKIEGKNGREYDTEGIIYRDLLKCAFESGGRNIELFLDKLSGGDYMTHAIMRWPDNDEPIGRYYSDKDVSDLQTLIRQLHSMYYQTKRGQEEKYDPSLHNKYRDYGKRSITEVKTELRTIFNEYQPDEENSLGDRVIQNFCYPLGIKSLTEAYDFFDDSQMRSFMRHRDLVKNNEMGQIRKGDLVKSIISSDYLPYLLENGVIAKEYLGVGEASDCTPLDTDVSMVLENPHDLRSALAKTSAAAFSNMTESENQHYYDAEESVFLIFRNDTRFVQYDSTTSFDEDKYEICGKGGGKVIKSRDYAGRKKHYMDDRSIRTGIPSSEIDYIATDEKSASKVIEAVKESGLYIPVTDLDGNLIYNPFE